MHANDLLPPSAMTSHVAESIPQQYVTFDCSARSFGIDIMSVREIRSWSPTTELPGQPRGARGVLDIRGRVVQVYDLATMLGTSTSAETSKSQVVLVVSLSDQDVGIVVDTVSDIIFATSDNVRPVPNGGRQNSGMVSTLVKVGDRLIAVLDLNALFPQDDVNLID
jgi:purine-binding chemotaxis protein CheW